MYEFGAPLTWDDEGIEGGHLQLGQVLHVAAGDAGALLQDVPLALRRLALAVVHHVHLVHVRRKHLHLVR